MPGSAPKVENVKVTGNVRDGVFPEFWFAGMRLKNKVIKVNPDEKDFIGLVEGQPFNGPVFMHQESSDADKVGYIGGRKDHNRTFAFPRIISIDPNNPYQFYDAKGSGFFHGDGIFLVRSLVINKDIDTQWGLMNKSYAEYDWKKWEEYSKDSRFISFKPVAIIELEELPILQEDGSVKIVSVQELKDTGKLIKSFVPIVYIRKFRNNTRFQNIFLSGFDQANATKIEKTKKEIEAAIKDVSKEVGRELSPDEYILEIVKRLAYNYGVIHRTDYQKYAHKGQYTLAGEVLDFDSNRGYPEAEDDVLGITLKDLMFSDLENSTNANLLDNLATFFDLFFSLFLEKSNIKYTHLYEKMKETFWENYVEACPDNTDFIVRSTKF
jgi:hypothetical protein